MSTLYTMTHPGIVGTQRVTLAQFAKVWGPKGWVLTEEVELDAIDLPQISQLAQATLPPTGNENVPLAQGLATRRMTLDDLADYFGSGTGGTGTGTVTSVNDVDPDEDGNVALDYSDVGASPSSTQTDLDTLESTVSSLSSDVSDLSALDPDQIDAHLAETDPAVHHASKITSLSTVAQGNVEDDLSWLHANTVGAANLAATDARAAALLAGQSYVLIDDFLFHIDVATSGSIGEKRWLRTGGTSVAPTFFGTAALADNPGAVRLQTGVTANTWTALYKEAMIPSGADWEINIVAVSLVVSNNVTLRAGVANDVTAFPSAADTAPPQAAGPANAVYVEKLITDSASWQLATRVASVETRVGTGVNLPGNSIQFHIRMWRYSATQVAVQIGTNGGALSAPTVVTWNPAATLLQPFFGIKNSSTTSRNAEVDFASVLFTGAVR